MAQNHCDSMSRDHTAKRPLAAAGGEIPQCKFKMPKRPTKNQKPPTAKELAERSTLTSTYATAEAAPSIIAMPPCNISRMLRETRSVVGVKLATHDWETIPGLKGGIGPHGFYTRCNLNYEDVRVIQVGWSISDSGLSKHRIVKPDGFHVSEKATKYHGISHDHAEAEGTSLFDVMSEFISDIKTNFEKGGRIVGHHLEFIATVVANELKRCGLGHMEGLWAEMVSAGLCTMDPELGKWVRTCMQWPTAPSARGNMLSVDEIYRSLCLQAPQGNEKGRASGVDARVFVNFHEVMRGRTRL